MRSRTLKTLGAGNFRPVSIASTSRMKSSTTLSILSRRPQNRLSLMKSMGQHSLKVTGKLTCSVFYVGGVFLPCRCLFNLGAQYSHCPPCDSFRIPASQYLEKLAEVLGGIAFSRAVKLCDHRFILRGIRRLLVQEVFFLPAIRQAFQILTQRARTRPPSRS